MWYGTGIEKTMEHCRVQVKIDEHLWNLIYARGGISWAKVTNHLKKFKLKKAERRRIDAFELWC